MADATGDSEDIAARKKRKDLYEDSWKGVDPKARKKTEDETFGKGKGPDWGKVGAADDPDDERNKPKVGRIIQVYPSKLYDHPSSKKKD